MKSLDEVIHGYECCLAINCAKCPYVNLNNTDVVRCDPTDKDDDALHYLKEYQRYQNTPSRMVHMAMCDENNPLTWEDLCKLNMIGSPVWNSNTRRWMLIIDSANDGTWIDLVNHAGGKEHWIEHDLCKNPLYRKERK